MIDGFNLFCAHLHVPPFLDPKLFIGYSPLDLGNSDVWGCSVFAVLLSKLVSEYARWSVADL